MDENEIRTHVQDLMDDIGDAVSEEEITKELKVYLDVYHISIDAAKRGIRRRYNITIADKAVNFEKIVDVPTRDNPIEIYELLDLKSNIGPMRPGQKEVLMKWYENHKNDKDTIIKMSTGEGKTLVGLLILQSKINSDAGPCIYICPNKYLVKQVCMDAEKFGIPVCEIDSNGNIPNEFHSGDKILVTNAHKVFNGMTTFNPKKKVSIGALVLDDSHACVDIIRSTFKITIEKKDHAEFYDDILALFEKDLDNQGPGSFRDIKEGVRETFMMVPYWAWHENIKNIADMLLQNNDKEQVRFGWPLIKDSLDHCACYISGSKIEIAHRCSNILAYDIFEKIKHRVYMSATVQDDSYSVKFLNLPEKVVKSPITTSNGKGHGERMIIIPSNVIDGITRGIEISEIMKHSNQGYGVAVITPSFKMADVYEECGATVARENIAEYVEKMKKGETQTPLVFANRYDGIDLPDKSCRVLVIDSMPYSDYLPDRYEEMCLREGDMINKKLAQKIEQGMGRGVRGERDYCVIIIVGEEIVRFVSNKEFQKYFSTGAQKQIRIGETVSKFAKDEAEETGYENLLFKLAKQCIFRDPGWREYYLREMQKPLPERDMDIYIRHIKEHEIEKDATNRYYSKAIEKLRKYINEYCKTPSEKGWYLQQMAEFYYLNKERDQAVKIQHSAYKSNDKMLKPHDYTHGTVENINEERIKNIRIYLNKYSDTDEFKDSTEKMLKNLSFGMDSKVFECAMNDIGQLLGYETHRPDQKIGKGPDNLWQIDEHYLLFECKNEVKEDRKNINKEEASQFLSHITWFEQEYGEKCTLDHFMIIPTNVLRNDAVLHQNTKIIRKGELEAFKKNVRDFIDGLIEKDFKDIDDYTISELLTTHGLKVYEFGNLYSVNWERKGER